MATYEQVTYNSPDGAIVGASASEKVISTWLQPGVEFRR